MLAWGVTGKAGLGVGVGGEADRVYDKFLGQVHPGQRGEQGCGGHEAAPWKELTALLQTHI